MWCLGSSGGGHGPAVGTDRPLPAGLRQVGQRLAPQQGQAQAAEPMGAGADQRIARPAVPAADRTAPRRQPPQGGDGQQALAAAAAVASEQHAPVGPQQFRHAAVGPLHPGPGGVARGHQGHGDAHGAEAAHRRQVGEVGRRRPPAHVAGAHRRLAEVDVLHQHVGVQHQGRIARRRSAQQGRTQQGGVIVELRRGGEGAEAPDQLRFPQLRQGGALRHGGAGCRPPRPPRPARCRHRR